VVGRSEVRVRARPWRMGGGPARVAGSVVAALALCFALVWPAAAAGKVDLNHATAAELATLPGIGEAKAQAIVAYRDTTPFRSVDDLLRVKGIGDRLLEQLRDKVEVPTLGGSPGGGGEVAGSGRGRPAAEKGQAAAGASPEKGAPDRRQGAAGS
jgi:competence ComEA-like helix-hairpin-helix protein